MKCIFTLIVSNSIQQFLADSDTVCLIQLIGTPSFMPLIQSQLVANSVAQSPIIIILSIPKYMNLKANLCSGAIDNYDEAGHCSLHNPYVSRRFGTCHSIWAYPHNLAMLVEIFESFQLAKLRYPGPVYYIFASTPEILGDILTISLRKDVVLPPAKTVVVTSKKWSYLCYFCPKEEILSFKPLREIPSTPKIGEPKSAHGSTKATFQSLHKDTEWLYKNQCQLYRRGIRIRTVHDVNRCAISFLLWSATSTQLNFTFGEGSMSDSQEYADNPLAYCENCNLDTPQDATI